QQSAETARAAWLAALALSALSALLAAGLGLRRSHEAVAGADTASTPTAQPHPDRAIAKRLLARLGQGRADPATGDAAATPPPTRREHH
ncbi:MAG: hypothetical protein Q8N44_07145, partial [Rubrivivax sp.]|nr:hypothetical protein [Rubrivivax sp.]